MKVTAVVVAYQSRECIDGCLRALRESHQAGVLECVVVDNASTDELLDRLAPLIRDDNAYRYSARELQALVSYRAGDVDGALSQLRALSDDPDAPPGLRQRSAEMITALGGV